MELKNITNAEMGIAIKSIDKTYGDIRYSTTFYVDPVTGRLNIGFACGGDDVIVSDDLLFDDWGDDIQDVIELITDAIDYATVSFDGVDDELAFFRSLVLALGEKALGITYFLANYN